MPLSHIEAWDDLIRRAKAAGIKVRFNHDGIAVLERAEPKPEDPRPDLSKAESVASVLAPHL